VIFLCGLTMLVAGVWLIPTFGLAGVGVAYLIASLPPAVGAVYIARRFFNEPSQTAFIRAVACPLFVGVLAFGATALIRRWTGELPLIPFLLLAGASASGTAALILAAEEVQGGPDSLTRMVLARGAKRIGLEKLIDKTMRRGAARQAEGRP
jgi:hypothetical protein